MQDRRNKWFIGGRDDASDKPKSEGSTRIANVGLNGTATAIGTLKSVGSTIGREINSAESYISAHIVPGARRLGADVESGFAQATSLVEKDARKAANYIEGYIPQEIGSIAKTAASDIVNAERYVEKMAPKVLGEVERDIQSGYKMLKRDASAAAKIIGKEVETVLPFF